MVNEDEENEASVLFPQVKKQLVYICRKYTAALVWQFQPENLTGKREKDSESFLKKFIPGLPWWLSGKAPTCQCSGREIDS